MERRHRLALGFGLASLLVGGEADAQVSAVVHGRVEDAITRAPLASVRVFAADSSSAVLSDSLGAFVLPLGPEAPLVVLTERLGYVSQRFDLPAEATSRLSILLLEPQVIQLETITVEEETALATLVGNIESRRNGHAWGSFRAFDRADLDRLRAIGSVWDFVRMRNPWLFPCTEDMIRVCFRGGIRTVANPYPEQVAEICLDERNAYASELAVMDISSVAIVELFDRTIVRIYTADFLLSRARRGQTQVLPIFMGCGPEGRFNF